MAVVTATACQISLPISAEEEKGNRNDAERKLNSFAPVPVKNNKILKAIMEAYETWERSPIVWVDSYPYRVKVLEISPTHAIIYQMGLGIYYKKSGKECYYILNKRKVRILFSD